jgi:hypothetical protein
MARTARCRQTPGLLLDREAIKKQMVRAARGQPLKEEDEARVPSSYQNITETPLRAEVGPNAQIFDIMIP